jgi:hypothetical protein
MALQVFYSNSAEHRYGFLAGPLICETVLVLARYDSGFAFR